jgi:hypothetical protein
VLDHQAQELPVSSISSFCPSYTNQAYFKTNNGGEAMLTSPPTHSLAAVNFFLGCVGVIQVSRILAYQRSIKDKTPAQNLEEVKDSQITSN